LHGEFDEGYRADAEREEGPETQGTWQELNPQLL
jgi:hypothetical protein